MNDNGSEMQLKMTLPRQRTSELPHPHFWVPRALGSGANTKFKGRSYEDLRGQDESNGFGAGISFCNVPLRVYFVPDKPLIYRRLDRAGGGKWDPKGRSE
jgi:hypothetical protein